MFRGVHAAQQGLPSTKRSLGGRRIGIAPLVKVAGCNVGGGLLMACSDGDEPVASTGEGRDKLAPTTSSEPVVIEGIIVEVMESWPLQLAVEGGGNRYHVELLHQTTVTRGSRDVNPGVLQPDQRVRVSGSGRGPPTQVMIAESIEILQ